MYTKIDTSRRSRFDRASRALAALAPAMSLLAFPAVAHAQSACDADTNADGTVDSADLGALLSAWGPCKACAGDLNGDNQVDSADLGALLSLWGESCVQGPIVKSISPNTAPRWGGADVVITGSNLENSYVMFGTTFVSPRSTSDSELIVSTPPLEPGVYDILVAKFDGSGSTMVDDALTVTATLVPDWATVVEELPDPEVVTDPEVLEAIQASGLPWRVLAGAGGLQGQPIPMVLVPSGWFFRGCSQPADGTACPGDAIPVRSIDMPAFYIGETEVTQLQFTSRGFANPSWYQLPGGGSNNNPVEGFGLQFDMWAFMQAVGCRLPTEAEWEYAYRARTDTAFFTGSNNTTTPALPAWLAFNSGFSQVVKQLAPNGFGLYDMAGNVAERVSDWYDSSYYSETGGDFDPQGPSSGAEQVVRGGSFNSIDSSEASAYRRSATGAAWPPTVGLRVAKSVPTNTVLTGVSPSIGLTTGGGIAKIAGQNLLNVTGVYFGGPYPMGTPATIFSKKWGEIVVQVPQGFPSMLATDIYVTTAATSGGQVVTLPQAFTYIDLSWATILDNQPDPTIVYNAQMRNKIAKSGLPARVRHNATGMEMLLVPEGSFNMGCSASQDFACSADELPVHPVTITKPFYLARYEWMNSEHPNGWFPNQNTPVINYTWNQLQPILQSYGLRMPTEAEWEYAYRAGTTTAYHAANSPMVPSFINGSDLEELKWLIGCLGTNIEGNPGCDAGDRLPNGLGFHDMTGNAREFVADWYGPYAADAQFDPTGPATGAQRVTRGGAWIEWYGRGRASSRTPWNPDLVSDQNAFPTGVRPAKSIR